MANINKELREKLAAFFSFPKADIKKKSVSKDGSVKYLLEVSPEVFIEVVLIQQPGRVTLCVSSQYGCAMGCAFCRTGTMGLNSNLSTGDIVRQVMAVIEDAGEGEELPFSNIVFMGMGEPLHNTEAVFDAIRILMDGSGLAIGPRKITLSTSGLVPGIREFIKAELGVNLAISLHATTDEVRKKIMPIAKRYPLSELIQVLHEVPLKPRKALTIEYVLLAGVNDTAADMKRLPGLLHGLKVKVNLIPYNENAGLGFKAPKREVISAWMDRLVSSGIDTTIRWSRGNDINAACGQLAVKKNDTKTAGN